MQLTAKELMTLLALVERINEEKAILAAQVTRLVAILVKKEVLTQTERDEMEQALSEQLEISRRTRIAENEPEDPTIEPLPRELGHELTLLGVVPDTPTIADTMEAEFSRLLEKVLHEFRRTRGQDGEAGNVAGI